MKFKSKPVTKKRRLFVKRNAPSKPETGNQKRRQNGFCAGLERGEVNTVSNLMLAPQRRPG